MQVLCMQRQQPPFSQHFAGFGALIITTMISCVSHLQASVNRDVVMMFLQGIQTKGALSTHTGSIQVCVGTNSKFLVTSSLLQLGLSLV
jgi:hypothetical protein